MKSSDSNIIFRNQWIFKPLLQHRPEPRYYRFSVRTQGSQSLRYESQATYSTPAEAYWAAYFFHLRASLDHEPTPALIVDGTGAILAINLLAFELLGIDAVGLNMLDFIVVTAEANQAKGYESMDQALLEFIQSSQTGQSHQPIRLRNADGHFVECRIQANVTPLYLRWLILRVQLTP